jgi:hypothetical protein
LRKEYVGDFDFIKISNILLSQALSKYELASFKNFTNGNFEHNGTKYTNPLPKTARFVLYSLCKKKFCFIPTVARVLPDSVSSAIPRGIAAGKVRSWLGQRR